MALPKGLIKLILLPVLFVTLIILASLITPMKDLTDGPRKAMNCPGTTTFNQTAWTAQTSSQHTIYSTGCYALHWDVIAFIGLLTVVAIWGWYTK